MALVRTRQTDYFICKSQCEAEDAVGRLKMIKIVTERSYVLCQVRTEVEETVDNVNIITETSCVLGQVRIEAGERVVDINIIIETVCILCQI